MVKPVLRSRNSTHDAHGPHKGAKLQRRSRDLFRILFLIICGYRTCELLQVFCSMIALVLDRSSIVGLLVFYLSRPGIF